MGSYIETNDTLQLTREQGFPAELLLEDHLVTPLTAEQFEGKVFSFHNKPSIRLYHAPPVRNFLVENRNGKWIYWGLIHMIEVTHDLVKKTTSGKFKLVYINLPEEMKTAHALIDRNEATSYFK